MAAFTALAFGGCAAHPALAWLAWLALAPALYEARVRERPNPKDRSGGRAPVLLLHALAAALGLACALWRGGLRSAMLCAAVYSSILLTAAAGRRLRPWAAPWAAAAAWTALEYAWSLLFGGPGPCLGLTQWRVPALLQLASLTGVWGLSFLAAFFAASLAEAAAARRRALLLPALGLAALALAFGGLRLALAPAQPGPEAAVLQGLAPEAATEGELLAAYLPLARAAAASDVLVWPPLVPSRAASGSGERRYPLAEEAAAAGARAQLFGSDDELGVSAGAGGRESGSARPVFGCSECSLGYDRGSGRAPQLVDSPLGFTAFMLGGEAYWPPYGRRLAASGAQVLVSLAGGGASSGAVLARLGFGAAVFRAVENGRPLVRAGNAGPSGVVDAQGVVQAWVPPGRAGWAAARLRLSPATLTPYSRFGDWLPWACALALLLLSLRRRLSPKAAAAGLSLALLAAPARAGFSGYLKDFPEATRTLLDDRAVWRNTARARLQWEGRSASGLGGMAVYDQEWRTGSWLDSLDRRSFGLKPPGGWVRLEGTLSEGRRSVWAHGFYRLYGEKVAGPVTVRLGRQRVAWGTGKLWNPTDVLNPYRPLSIERDERGGVDAAWLRAELGDLSQAEAAFAPQDRWADGALLARLRLHPGKADLSFMGGKAAGGGRAWMAGGDLAIDAGDNSLHGEWSFTREAARDYWRLLAGWERSLEGPAWLKDAWLMAEAYHNGAGASSPARYSFAGLLSGREVSLGRDYLGFGARREVHALWTLEAYLIYNLHDESWFAGPALSWEAAQDLRLGAGWQRFTGPSGSEFGRLKDLGWLQAQYYFQAGS